jgi:excinuclease ABC subunit C
MSTFSSPNESTVSMTMTNFRGPDQVPPDPGVYLMKDNEGNIIYIGKAKNLRKRVLSYFSHAGSSDRNQGVEWKTKKLVAKVSDVEFVTTENEIEAFLLESNLIKRYRPIYNIELKEQQRYTYLILTQDTFPRLLVSSRNRSGDFSWPKWMFYGPFLKGSSKFLSV